jgi:hypothetical protein
MKFFSGIKSILSGLYGSLKRFPLTIILSILVAVTLITLSETKPVEDTLAKIAMVLALGIPLSLCIKLYFEKRNEENTYKIFIGYALALLFQILYYVLFIKGFEMVSVTRYVGLSVALYLAFVFVPYLPNRDHIEMYSIKLLTNFFITVIYSVVLFGGLSAILFAIDSLLGITIQGEVYYYTWLCVVFIFAISYFLAGVPSKYEEPSPANYPKLLRILLLYIVMPLITAYTIILYIYFAKIIITTQWPVGLVVNLVLWYSVITAIVLFFITPVKEEKNWPKKFFAIMPKAILPILAMMFVSIWIRVNAYGITENRYYVILLGLWVTFIMLYYSFIKGYRNLFIPLTLSLLALVSVFGPLSSFSISKMSQNNRLESLLSKNNMLIEDKIQPSQSIPKEDRSQVSSILDYFNRNHSLNEVKYLPKDFKIENMTTVLGFPFENEYYIPETYFNFIRTPYGEPININGYDYLFDGRSLNNKESNQSSFQGSYDYDTSIVKIKYNNNEVYSKDLNAFVKDLISKHGLTNGENRISSEEMTLIEENETISVKFIILNISGSTSNSTSEVAAKGIEFYLAVKLK